ncbi:hypothetical protein [Spirillospora sp. NBC_01491]|uniref:hypothetical protein n=1 Tax=Spirillospora sp. NBC_01491 TaxID=2976007 RepID=UPI002E35EE13|nr:hypothetical protein [Spirillospora sp. NBC_01491]
MSSDRPVTNPAWMVPDFDVFWTPGSPDGGSWRAVLKADPEVVHDAADWDALSARCAVTRCVRTLRAAATGARS